MTSLPPPVLVRTKPIPADLASILWPRIVRDVTEDENGCWIRTAGVNPVTGYTTITRRIYGKRSFFLAHRVMFTAYRGQIPDGYTVDHLCEVVACCNPEHLRAVPHRENVLRSKKNPCAVNARKDTCANGHALVNEGRKRLCKECRSIQARQRRLARRAAGVPEGESHGTARAYGYWSCRCDECRAFAHHRYLQSKADIA